MSSDDAAAAFEAAAAFASFREASAALGTAVGDLDGEGSSGLSELAEELAASSTASFAPSLAGVVNPTDAANFIDSMMSTQPLLDTPGGMVPQGAPRSGGGLTSARAQRFLATDAGQDLLATMTQSAAGAAAAAAGGEEPTRTRRRFLMTDTGRSQAGAVGRLAPQFSEDGEPFVGLPRTVVSGGLVGLRFGDGQVPLRRAAPNVGAAVRNENSALSAAMGLGLEQEERAPDMMSPAPVAAFESRIREDPTAPPTKWDVQDMEASRFVTVGSQSAVVGGLINVIIAVHVKRMATWSGSASITLPVEADSSYGTQQYRLTLPDVIAMYRAESETPHGGSAASGMDTPMVDDLKRQVSSSGKMSLDEFIRHVNRF